MWILVFIMANPGHNLFRHNYKFESRALCQEAIKQSKVVLPKVADENEWAITMVCVPAR
jgi:hypothetical protein